jgi:PhnB protein
MSFHPYLAFAGNAGEAFTRYQEIFGGELMVMRKEDAPDSEDMSDWPDGFVLHAALTVGDDLLMGADSPPGTFDGENRGLCCNVSVDDVPTAEKYFAGLSEGGVVQMPITATFFSPAFGMCVDRFGTPWMVVANDPNAAA